MRKRKNRTIEETEGLSEGFYRLTCRLDHYAGTWSTSRGSGYVEGRGYNGEEDGKEVRGYGGVVVARADVHSGSKINESDHFQNKCN